MGTMGLDQADTREECIGVACLAVCSAWLPDHYIIIDLLSLGCLSFAFVGYPYITQPYHIAANMLISTQKRQRVLSFCIAYCSANSSLTPINIAFVWGVAAPPIKPAGADTIALKLCGEWRASSRLNFSFCQRCRQLAEGFMFFPN